MKLLLEQSIVIKSRPLSNYARSRKLCRGMKAKGVDANTKQDYPSLAPVGAHDWFESLIEFDEELNIPIV